MRQAARNFLDYLGIQYRHLNSMKNL